MHGISPSAVPAALARVGLADVAKERVSGFSQGMRQRVALARALLRRPELLLLDEPYAGLDAEAKEIVDAAIAEGLADGRTVVLATHDLQRGGTAARTIVMDQGRIVG